MMGTKQRNQLFLLAALLVVAAVAWYASHSHAAGDLGPSTTVENTQLLAVENPQLHRDRMLAAQRAEYRGSGRNPFSTVAPPPPVSKQTVAQAHVHMGPDIPPPPPPPMLPGNVKFFGYGTVPNGTSRRAFLTDGEEVYIVAEGDLFLGRYRIVKVNNANLEFEEISSGRHNTVALMLDEQGAPTS
ncbi:MAG: hypothetical protein NVS9B13_26180 [Candidatus Acidiferrum sp.]